MFRYFGDILERVGEPPSWWDENGVPRFGSFQPELVADYYASEAALLLISCQCCQKEFHVACSGTSTVNSAGKSRVPPMIRDLILAHELHYGDPPNARCCEAGPATNSAPRRVLEYWVKPYVLVKKDDPITGLQAPKQSAAASLAMRLHWKRDPSFEREINRSV